MSWCLEGTEHVLVHHSTIANTTTNENGIKFLSLAHYDQLFYKQDKWIIYFFHGNLPCLNWTGEYNILYYVFCSKKYFLNRLTSKHNAFMVVWVKHLSKLTAKILLNRYFNYFMYLLLTCICSVNFWCVKNCMPSLQSDFLRF